MREGDMADETMQWKQLGDRLRQAREYVEMKQEVAAEAVGMPRPALSLIENGRRKVDAVELARFAALYNQSIESLTGTAELPPLPENVRALARAATKLSANDRSELLRFAEFLQARDGKGSSDG
jgi:transcriptional regulator with XRE-family HTH domain